MLPTINSVNLGEDWFHNKNELSALLTQDMVVIEVGSYYGRSSRFFAEHCKTVYCIDHWLGSPEEIHMNNVEGMLSLYDQFLFNTKDYKNIIPIRAWSSLGLRYLKMKGVSPSLIYVDAGHTYEEVYSDIVLASQFENAIITGDDYSWGADTPIKRAVERFCSEKGCTHEVKRNWFWRIIK